MVCYNPLDKFYKSHTGAVRSNEKTTFRVKGNFDSVVFVLRNDKDGVITRHQMNKVGDYFEISLSFDSGLYFYCFKLSDGLFIGLNNNLVGEVTTNPNYFQLTVYSEDYKVPKWLSGGVIYQIFPDRFYSFNKNKKVPEYKVLHKKWDETPVFLPNKQGEILNNDFFGGDLKGIEKKLPYLVSLGVTAIYLNPIFKAYSNHRYDTGDYFEIDPLLGDESDLVSLIKQADECGIKIILDGVFNHTGDDSVYFNKYNRYKSLGAFQSKQSKYYDWYNFKNHPHKYQSWWGIKTLPSTNKTSSGYVDFIAGKGGVIEHYTKLGIGGWRLDVVDELPDSFVRKIRSSVKEINDDAIIIGEVWEDVSNKISYGVRREYFQGKELDSAMNYPLKDAIIDFVKKKDANKLSKTVKEQIEHYPFMALNSMMNIISTHDTVRLLTVVGGRDGHFMSKSEMAEYVIEPNEYDNAKFKLKIASLLQFTLCGVPSVYYGDEAGMQGYTDPLNRRTYPWGKEDKDIVAWYKFLGSLRKKYDAFNNGEYNEIYVDQGCYVYTRVSNDSEVMIAINLSKNDYTLEFEGKLFDLITKSSYKDKFRLYGSSCAVLIKK